MRATRPSTWSATHRPPARPRAPRSPADLDAVGNAVRGGVDPEDDVVEGALTHREPPANAIPAARPERHDGDERPLGAIRNTRRSDASPTTQIDRARRHRAEALPPFAAVVGLRNRASQRALRDAIGLDPELLAVGAAGRPEPSAGEADRLHARVETPSALEPVPAS